MLALRGKLVFGSEDAESRGCDASLGSGEEEAKPSPSSTDRLLNEYEIALAKSKAEAQGLRAKLESCLGLQSTLRQEAEDAYKKLVSPKLIPRIASSLIFSHEHTLVS